MDIIYQDDRLLVINKPSGLLVHRSPISSDRDSVLDQFKKMFENPPTPLHRLDRPTSGILISAFDKETVKKVSMQFRNRDIKKKYLSVVRGWPEEEGIIEIPLKKEGKEESQDALTRWKVICRAEIDVPNNRYPKSRYSFLEIDPETGRYHQIRRHLARIGHPIPGDTSHGDLRHNTIINDFTGIPMLLLHAYSIIINYPGEDSKICFKAKLPENYTTSLNKIFGKETISDILEGMDND